MTCGDTLINDKKYLKVYKQEQYSAYEFDISKAWYFCALRNDTLNKKVYAVYPFKAKVYDYQSYIENRNPLYTATTTTEFLLYDFSLAMGDTVYVYEYQEPESILGVPLIVVNGFSYWDEETGGFFYDSNSFKVLDNGDSRKQIFLMMPEGTDGFSTAWIEGIGSIHGLIKHINFIYTFPIPHPLFLKWILLCYENKNELLLSTFWNINNNCFRFYGNGICENKIADILIVYPNPATDFIKIKNIEELNLSNYEIEIFDIMGRRQKAESRRQKTEDEMEIDISHLKAGYYFIKIVDSQININMKGFVKL